jgi:hypothetical protein
MSENCDPNIDPRTRPLRVSRQGSGCVGEPDHCYGSGGAGPGAGPDAEAVVDVGGRPAALRRVDVSLRQGC